MTDYRILFDGDRNDGFGNPGRRVEAEYYKREENWIAFKSADHKIILEIPETQVKSIERIQTRRPPSEMVQFDGDVDGVSSQQVYKIIRQLVWK